MNTKLFARIINPEVTPNVHRECTNNLNEEVASAYSDEQEYPARYQMLPYAIRKKLDSGIFI